MRSLLLAAAASIAAIALPAAPAQAQNFTAGKGSGNGSSVNGPDFSSQWHRDDDGRISRRRNRGDVFIGQWPQQGDTLWRSDSFNDWWHERPLRSTPRWVFSNQDCARRYWSGGGWRC